MLLSGLARSLRFASRQARHVPQNRLFSFSLPRRASHDSELTELYARLSNTTLARKLQNAPSAMEAMREFAEVMQKLGIDMSSGKPPSTMQMMKLAMDKQARESGMKVAEEFKKAGIDFTDKDVVAEVMSAMKKE